MAVVAVTTPVAQPLSVHVLRSPLLPGARVSFLIPWAGQTTRELLTDRELWLSGWQPGLPLAAIVDGRRVADDELDAPLRPGADVLIAPDPRGIELVLGLGAAILIGAATAYASKYAIQKALKSLQPQQRGEQSSQTYDWSGIESEYRAGFPIPIVLGEHDVGGQVIYTETVNSASTPNSLLTTILAISEGRIESIGGVTGGTTGEANRLGAFGTLPQTAAIPADLRVNGNRFDESSTIPGIEVWLRMGEIGQTALDPAYFNGARTTQQLSAELPDLNSSFVATISSTETITAVRVNLQFPGGLYSTAANGQLQSFSPFIVRVDVRDAGGVVVGSGVLQLVRPAQVSAFSVSLDASMSPFGVSGPLTVEVTRLSPQGGSNVSSQMLWTQVVYAFPHTFAYPGVALLGMRLPATELISGGRPSYLVRARGVRVRVWDATIGSGVPSTTRYWSLPASGDPYFGIWTYEPGRNPAWLLAEFLTARWGLGQFFTDAMIDWQSFRNWADFCDQSVNLSGVPEAAFRCDYVLDNPQAAFEVMATICSTGRAIPYFDGDKVRIRYQYQAAHGRGTNAVAAKTRSQIVTTGNVTDFSIEYLNTIDRPGVIVFEILNRDKDYSRDPIPIEDPNGGFNDPRTVNPLRFSKRNEQLPGVTRESQARRDGLFQHDANRLIRSKVTFSIGAEALASEVGDVIGVQHDALRPYSTESFAFRLSAASSASTTIRLDHDVTLAGGTTYTVVLRTTAGTIVEANVTSGAGTYVAGSAITISTAVTALKGAPCAFGVFASGAQKVVKDYEIVSVSLTQGLRRQVIAIDWVPAIHTLPDVGASIAAQTSPLFVTPPSPEAAPAASYVRVTRLPEPGYTAISWMLPDGYEGHVSRVYVRRTGQDGWLDLGEHKHTSVETAALVPGDTYDVAVSVASRAGTFAPPGTAAMVTVTVDEFPAIAVPAIKRATSASKGDGLLLRWQPVDNPLLDYYEVRVGPYWTGAQVLGRTREPQLHVVAPAPIRTTLGVTYLVAARMKHGLYSAPYPLTPPAWAPNGMTLQLGFDVDPSTQGTLSELTWDSTTKELRVADGKLVGTWTSTPGSWDIGFEVGALWRLGYWTRQQDTLTVGEATFACGSGEARWRTVHGRDASNGSPGWEMDETVADLAVPIAQLGDRRVATYHGQTGHNVHARLDVRYDKTNDGIYEVEYQSYRPEVRNARIAQFRLQLRRRDTTRQVYCGGLRTEVYA